MQVLGEVPIKDSSVTASGRSGVLAWKEDGCEGIVTVRDNVESSGNNTSNRANNADYTARAGGTSRGGHRSASSSRTESTSASSLEHHD